MKKIKWLFLVLALLIFGVLAYLVTNNQTGDLDSSVYSIVTFSKTDFLTGFYKFITFFSI